MKWDHSLIDTLEWGNQISHKEDKIKIADLIASKVENGQVIGVGSAFLIKRTVSKVDILFCHIWIIKLHESELIYFDSYI